ncbi:MAG: endopeptidase La [Muribaculaceae bacterium]|nr:endopeptidase La [Muribaculaceae bacterium]
MQIEIPAGQNDIDGTKMRVIRVDQGCPMPYVPMSIPDTFDENEDALRECIANGLPVILLYQDKDKYKPLTNKGLAKVGVWGRIMRRETNSEGESLMLAIGGPRLKVTEFHSDENKQIHAIVEFADWKIAIEPKNEVKNAAYLHELCQIADDVHTLENREDIPKAFELLKKTSRQQFVSSIIFSMSVAPEVKYEMLKISTLNKVIEKALEHLSNLRQLLELRRDINNKVNKKLDANQRENFIQHQIEMLQKEVGQGVDSDIVKLRERASDKHWDEETQSHFDREIGKLQRLSPNTPDYSIQYSYLDTLLNLPWKNYSEIDLSLDKIEGILEEDHYGLERVKERILEQMAVTALRQDNKSPIICLVGPPGVGKTSLGKSIARAMGREYGRVAFGGLHDEAEIRGHRRTYIGAMPGRIISALLKMNNSNPVIVLDEIDKIGKDYKGDPSTALLEVLDPEQNSRFHDNYIDTDYDLSQILFIATANSLETVDGPLRDRMEIISIPGYISQEKVEIAKRHLIAKQLEANGLKDEEISFNDDALTYIIEYYTRESGVRRLEKMIGKVLRKIAVKKVRGQEFSHKISRDDVKSLLGKEEFNPEIYENNDSIGVVTGLAWTQVGGEILFIESSITEGKGNLTLTGNLGDVMKESATIALKYLKAHAADLGLSQDMFDKHDVHIHVPEGAIPKDGPSAGITMATSLASSFTGRKVRPRLAMTGEITLRGKVLPVGGIREKIIAAKRAGITEIIISKENEKDINEIKPMYLEGLTFKYVDNVFEVLNQALL